ncbi:MAG: hypothetical protein WC770_04560 [Phycisphaerae bacterium]|jgi:hypothetical protein
MGAMQKNATQNQFQKRQPPTPPPQPEYHFRWAAFIGMPAIIIIFLYIIKNIEPSFSFEDILGKLGVIHKTEYARLMCMAVICIAFILIVKLFRNKQD